MRRKRRLGRLRGWWERRSSSALGAMSVLAAMTCGAPAVYGQMAAGDSGARPVILTFSYTGELVHNAGGGARRGTTFAGGAGGELTLLLGRLVGWHGARIFVFALGTHGGAPSDLVGDVQGVSNLEAPPALRLEEAWLQQNLLDNRLSWLVGRYDLNTEFYRLQSGALFPRPDTVGAPRQRRFGIGRGRARPYGGKLAIGAWYYTARFSDLVDTLPNGAWLQHRGSGGVYLIGDLTVRSLTAFAQLGLGDGRVNQIGGYLGGGFTLTAPFSSRAQDALGLAMAAARNGSHYERAQTAGGPAAGETSVELTYLAQLGSWLTVQPDVQYVIHPGGTRATRNAVVPGLRIAVSH